MAFIRNWKIADLIVPDPDGDDEETDFSHKFGEQRQQLIVPVTIDEEGNIEARIPPSE